MDSKPIRTELDHAAAVKRIEHLWESAKGTSSGDELDALVTLVEAFESKHYPMDTPSRTLVDPVNPHFD
jgi:HTH-type transcriptional regulator / antitoxin HigA